MVLRFSPSGSADPRKTSEHWPTSAEAACTRCTTTLLPFLAVLPAQHPVGRHSEIRAALDAGGWDKRKLPELGNPNASMASKLCEPMLHVVTILIKPINHAEHRSPKKGNKYTEPITEASITKALCYLTAILQPVCSNNLYNHTLMRRHCKSYTSVITLLLLPLTSYSYRE